ncbi:NHLP leader peptide family RiPP precursor [Floridanema aerugineum]|uniref:NHLP leader peptide family RiPP n=1 Tax=Floridaenema aerugineum BLCC-F46 TaxID=3153654 RepID=A0ABV4XCW3_9CYAN
MNNINKTTKAITPLLPLWSYQLQMDSKLAIRTRKDLEVHLITRALKDEAFRHKLVANPKAVIEEELGKKLPATFEIITVEETETTLYMVLPCNPYEGVSEEELKSLVGMAYEDIAQWVLEQQRNTLLDEVSSVPMFIRVWKDKDFKHKLLYSPKMVIEEECGVEIPENIEIKILEETVHILYIVLPRLDNELVPKMIEWFDDIKSARKPQPLFAKIPVGYCSSFQYGSSCSS